MIPYCKFVEYFHIVIWFLCILRDLALFLSFSQYCSEVLLLRKCRIRVFVSFGPTLTIILTIFPNIFFIQWESQCLIEDYWVEIQLSLAFYAITFISFGKLSIFLMIMPISDWILITDCFYLRICSIIQACRQRYYLFPLCRENLMSRLFLCLLLYSSDGIP